MLGDMLAAYRRGDLAALEKTLNAVFDDFPALRKRILKDRHDKWLPQIENMIADGRTHLIIVGAADLVGPDSVIVMLRAKGVKVEGPYGSPHADAFCNSRKQRADLARV